MNNGACGLRGIPSLGWLAVAVGIAALAAGCGGQTRDDQSGKILPPGPGVTNLVFLGTNGGNKFVAVVETNASGFGATNANNVVVGQRIEWINNGSFAFSVVFSPVANPHRTNGWEIHHSSHPPVSVVAPPLVGGKTNILKYTVVAFEEAPSLTGTPSPDAATNRVVVTSEDPFIIIR